MQTCKNIHSSTIGDSEGMETPWCLSIEQWKNWGLVTEQNSIQHWQWETITVCNNRVNLNHSVAWEARHKRMHVVWDAVWFAPPIVNPLVLTVQSLPELYILCLMYFCTGVLLYNTNIHFYFENIFRQFIIPISTLRFYLLLERGERREKERVRNINVWLPFMCHLLGTLPATQACLLTGNWTSDPLDHRMVLNPLSHTSQG